jgi:hypothetical protein
MLLAVQGANDANMQYQLSLLVIQRCAAVCQVTVAPLPIEVFGQGSQHTWPLRRIDKVVNQAEVAERAAREMLKVCWTPLVLVCVRVCVCVCGVCVCVSLGV